MQENNLVSVSVRGGLGNILFKVSTAIAYSKKYNKKLVLEDRENKENKILNNLIVRNNTYQDTVLHRLNWIKNYNNINWLPYHENHTSINGIPNSNTNLRFLGDFQSTLYFEHIKSELKELYKPDINIENKINQLIENYKKNDETLISIHVRRGDYLSLSNIFLSLPLSYYEKCIKYFEVKYKNIKFLVFSDDINWCKENFKGEKFSFVEENNDVIEFYLMSKCEHHINANSTFSWWASYLSNESSETLIPKNWLTSKFQRKNRIYLLYYKWKIIDN